MKDPALLRSYEGKHRTMRVAETGNPAAPTVLFIHGSPGSWEAWAGFLNDPTLSGAFRMLSVDRPGFGGSGKGKAELSLTKQAEDIALALENTQDAIVVGHSYGAPVAVKLATLFPEKVKGLILVAGSVDPELEENKWYQYVARWWPLRYAVPAALEVCNEEIMALKNELLILDTEYEKFTAPVWVIQGDKDDLVQKENVDYLKKKLGTKIVHVDLIENLNHFIPWKRPDLIRNAIRKISAVPVTKL